MLFVSGCNESGEKVDSNLSITKQPYESSYIENDSNTNNSHTESNSDVNNNNQSVDSEIDGEPLEFADKEVKSCVLKELGFTEIDGNSILTDKMCEKVTKLSITGFITTLEDLKYLPNLTEFYVDNKDHELNLKGINKALKLTKVSLIDCRLSEVDRLADLTELEYLDISTSSSRGNRIDDYSSLASLTKLKYLNMEWRGYNAYNQFGLKDGSFINDLTSLEELNILETGIKNYSLESLSNLKKLSISECNVDIILEQLCKSGAISILDELTIYPWSEFDNSALSANGICNYLSKAENLKRLTLGRPYCEIESLKGLGNLKSLEYLYFDNELYHLPLSAYNELTQLNNLKELVLTGRPNAAEYEKLSEDYAFLGEIKNLEHLTVEPYDGLRIECFSSLEFLNTLELKGLFSLPDTVDISGIEKFKSLKKLCYTGVKFKSTAPLDDLDYLIVEEIPLI